MPDAAKSSQDTQSASPQTAAATSLLPELEERTRGLLYMSENDFPLEPFLWPKAQIENETLTSDALLQLTRHRKGTPVEELDFEAFFEPVVAEEDWFGPEEKQAAAGFRALVTWLETHLTDLRVFKIGSEPKKEVYVVGQTAEGDFAGVITQVVET
jgi:hypothetical protein